MTTPVVCSQMKQTRISTKCHDALKAVAARESVSMAYAAQVAVTRYGKIDLPHECPPAEKSLAVSSDLVAACSRKRLELCCLVLCADFGSPFSNAERAGAPARGPKKGTYTHTEIVFLPGDSVESEIDTALALIAASPPLLADPRSYILRVISPVPVPLDLALTPARIVAARQALRTRHPSADIQATLRLAYALSKAAPEALTSEGCWAHVAEHVPRAGGGATCVENF